MLELCTDTYALLSDLTEAYATGDAALGELLFVHALEEQLPWDQVCAAAATGIARQFGEQPRV